MRFANRAANCCFYGLGKLNACLKKILGSSPEYDETTPYPLSCCRFQYKSCAISRTGVLAAPYWS